MSQRSKPHLPHQLVVDILKEPWMKSCKSFAFSEGAHRRRCDIVDGNKDDISAETYVLGLDGGCFMLLDNFRQGKSGWFNLMSMPSSSSSKPHHLYMGYSILNMAIDDGDPLFAFESIRLGALVNATNGRGQTPLLQCLERMYDLVELEKIIAFSPPSLRAAAGLDNLTFLKARMNRIALLLVEQHADVNATVKWQGKSVTPLYFATCVLRDFELARLLLTHGADPYPHSPAESIRTDMLHFQQLAEETRTRIKNNGGIIRPPRPCPCFSGKALSDCHDTGERHPYPDEFLCKCGSEKAYSKCCKGRNMQTVERWNSKEQWCYWSSMLCLFPILIHSCSQDSACSSCYLSNHALS
ncbi:hypothetical protein BDP27DRAFT_1057628 [Rhodocollybia butyracea]|uniref:Uncharacterized protein n=1 Tax=Rhodocollybia butyracea TaxID=206335 RepID=A0A9P5PLJ3_9AGAR|nr:hypothetical protein BDP27DRAFT_1057628 [Rhodocollybia butyracea]